MGLFGMFINSISITGDMNLISLVVATNAVMVLAITQQATVVLLWSTAMLWILASFGKMLLSGCSLDYRF